MSNRDRNQRDNQYSRPSKKGREYSYTIDGINIPDLENPHSHKPATLSILNTLHKMGIILVLTLVGMLTIYISSLNERVNNLSSIINMQTQSANVDVLTATMPTITEPSPIITNDSNLLSFKILNTHSINSKSNRNPQTLNMNIDISRSSLDTEDYIFLLVTAKVATINQNNFSETSNPNTQQILNVETFINGELCGQVNFDSDNKTQHFLSELSTHCIMELTNTYSDLTIENTRFSEGFARSSLETDFSYVIIALEKQQGIVSNNN